jgi:6-phosphogluconolactonase
MKQNPKNNRRFFPAKILLALSLIALAANVVSAKEFFVYFGTYTNALSRGIYVSRLDADTGKISAPELAAAAANPCFVNSSPAGNFLYSANSTKFNGENSGSVAAFAIDKKSGALKLLNEKSSGGNGPCHVSVDASGKTLLAANYGGGSVKSFLINDDGSIGAEGTRIQFHGHSTNTNRQSAPHAHFICADPSGRFALVCDLGTDKISVFPLQPETARLAAEKVFEISVPPGGGARHLAFSRDGKFVHVVNEMACSVTTFSWDAGRLAEIETVALLPTNAPVQKGFSAAEIRVHPSGKFVYATVRGHDSVSVLAADAATGKLKLVQNLPSGGKVPRGLGIDPTGRWLFTAHQRTDNAVEFAIDPATGNISPTGAVLKIGAPVDVHFVAAE